MLIDIKNNDSVVGETDFNHKRKGRTQKLLALGKESRPREPELALALST